MSSPDLGQFLAVSAKPASPPRILQMLLLTSAPFLSHNCAGAQQFQEVASGRATLLLSKASFRVRKGGSSHLKDPRATFAGA